MNEVRFYMFKLYQMNSLSIVEVGDEGVYAENISDSEDDAPMPVYQAPDYVEVGDAVDAFLYRDSSGRLVATMQSAYVEVGQCANLEVVSSSQHGVFLNWGMPKDLFLPDSEQAYYVDDGDFCVVYVYMDKEGRPVASSKLYRHLSEKQDDLVIGQAVDLLISDETDLGYKAVINHTQLGLIYHNELSQPLQLGVRMRGWVKEIREDGKINLNINALDSETRDELEQKILFELEQAGGRLDMSDKSAPEEIYRMFKVSKKNFKRALGSLYKQRLITISAEYIERVSPSE